VKHHHKLRRVSCSAWANLEQMAEHLQGNFILSLKPPPSAIAVFAPDWNSIRNYLRRAIEIAGGGCLEIIMKDNHTLGNRPENVVEWVRTAKDEAERE
jgi:hypothetical protein